MFAIFRKETTAFLHSLVGYVVMGIFLVITGLFLWVFPQTSIPDHGFADIDPLFNIAPYVFMFLIPAITMRMFAEEKKSGTIELLMTRPLSDWELVGGKYLAGLLLTLVALLPTLIYYWSVYQLGSPVGNIDTAAIIGSYLGLVMLAVVFTAIGVFASSLNENQIVAFILAVFLCFFMYEGFTSLASLDIWGSYQYFISQIGIDFHYRSLSRGLVDSRNLVYFISVGTVMLALTKLVLSSRRW